MDTASFIQKITWQDVFEDIIKTDIYKFDTSDYPQNNRQGNKKVLGPMKHEANGLNIT